MAVDSVPVEASCLRKGVSCGGLSMSPIAMFTSKIFAENCFDDQGEEPVNSCGRSGLTVPDKPLPYWSIIALLGVSSRFPARTLNPRTTVLPLASSAQIKN